MAQTATIYNFDVDLADSDRHLYESLALRVARHPSESEEYMVTRLLAYRWSSPRASSFREACRPGRADDWHSRSDRQVHDVDRHRNARRRTAAQGVESRRSCCRLHPQGLDPVSEAAGWRKDPQCRGAGAVCYRSRPRECARRAPGSARCLQPVDHRPRAVLVNRP